MRNSNSIDQLPKHSGEYQRMIRIFDRLAPKEGYTNTLIDSVRLMRSHQPLTRMPVLYEPSICIVVQGRKRGFLGEEVFLYDALHYLTVSVPMAFESETDASEDEPLLGIALSIQPTVVAELALEIAKQAPGLEEIPSVIFSTPLDDAMSNVILRLLETLESPQHAQILGSAILREIYYRVLTGEQGSSLRATVAQGSYFDKIAKALRRIHAEYNNLLDVTSLAGEAGMSVPAFHAHFKSITKNSPLQYIKNIRLHQARLMMIRNGVTAATASIEVGYESTSQFSREFKRMFGRTPTEEVMQMKSVLALQPAEKVA